MAQILELFRGEGLFIFEKLEKILEICKEVWKLDKG